MFRYKTEPYTHQRSILQRTQHKKNFAYFLEMGTGKTKIILDLAAGLFLKKEITALVVVAPSGVHRQWIEAALPEHMSDSVKYMGYFWTGKTSLSDERTRNELISPSNFLVCSSINFEAVNTKRGFNFVQQILLVNKTLFVIDESSKIKNQQAKRTKKLINLSKLAPYKRILSGTPVTQSPLDLYSQFAFLDHNIIGFSSYVTFRNRYAVLDASILKSQLYSRLRDWKIVNKVVELKQAGEYKGIKMLLGAKHSYVSDVLGKGFFCVSGYKNVEELKNKINPHTIFLKKNECLDLPEKIYSTSYTKLSAMQQQIYDQVKKNILVEYKEQRMTVQNVLTELLRLQQIVGGFFKSDSSPKASKIEKETPKIKILMSIIENIEPPKKIIIWSRFVDECKMIYDRLKENAVLFIGDISKEEKEENINKFQNAKNIRFFIGTQASGGIGRNLTAAEYMIYYSNDFSLETRLQSEDRAHRIGQKNILTIVDIIANNTIDEKIIKVLKNKEGLAKRITIKGVKDILD